MKITRLTIKNIGKIEAVEINPETNAVIIQGKNEAGKSTVLDSIFVALTGKRPDDFIRHGQNEGLIVVDLDMYRVKRTFKPNKTELEVINKNGVPYSGAPALLKKLIGVIAFDPLEFAGMRPADQANMLLQAANVNLEKYQAARSTAYDERTAVNRDVKSLKAQLAAMPEVPATTPDEELSVPHQLDVIGNLEDRKRQYLEWHLQAKAIGEKQTKIAARIEDILSQLINARNVERALQIEFDVHAGKAPTPPQESDITEAKAHFNSIDTINQDVRKKQAKADVSLALDASQQASASLDNKLVEIDALRNSKVQAADFGIDGLTVDDDGVAVDGVAFSRLATSKQIRVSAAIAMKMNPELKVILVREGSLLDDDSLKELIDQVSDQDYQIWIEKVCSDGQGTGIVIEDGHIK